MHRATPISAIVLAVAGLLAGCGSSGSSSTGGSASASSTSTLASPAGGSGLTLTEREFKISPATKTVAKPGKVAITVVNTGKLVHALEVQGPGGEQKTGNINPGGTVTITVDLRRGAYTLYCPIDGHRKLGMQGRIVVGSSAAGSGGAATGGAAAPSSSTSSTSSDGSAYGGRGY
jgi:uncharacterized cupredoxin-like copper-binding protein